PECSSWEPGFATALYVVSTGCDSYHRPLIKRSAAGGHVYPTPMRHGVAATTPLASKALVEKLQLKLDVPTGTVTELEKPALAARAYEAVKPPLPTPLQHASTSRAAPRRLPTQRSNLPGRSSC
ncbi:MAG: hypothetical protein RL277_1928, partial [Planctomycetota bacterium]